jgi:5-methylcytosine-specific restriction endonuclease McrA
MRWGGAESISIPNYEMNTTMIWNTVDLRAQWEHAITPKLVDYFERFVHAPNPHAFKTKKQHHDDTEIPLKHIDRQDESLVEFLNTVGLVRLERRGDRFSVTPLIPVSVSPPRPLCLPLYASFNRKVRARVNRRRIYDLDGGICAYCGKKTDFENCVIDHIYPFNRGGADDEKNLTVQCSKCKKWHYLPGDKGWLDPINFRGKRVKRVGFIEKDGFKYPDFEFEDS